MKICILTLFPEFFDGYFDFGIVKRAIENKEIEIQVRNIRDYSKDPHHKVDDYPYGGGAGMLMTPQPLFDAIKDTKGELIHLSPRGQTLTDQGLNELAKLDEVTLLCSHYEGVDQRVLDYFKPREISIGDYILSGGEISALVLLDGILRKIPKVISHESLDEESFTDGLLEYDQYTRPQDYEGLKVPDVLISGHHQNIEEFRLESSLRRTLKSRKDLIEKGIKENRFSEDILKMLEKIREEDLHE